MGDGDEVLAKEGVEAAGTGILGGTVGFDVGGVGAEDDGLDRGGLEFADHFVLDGGRGDDTGLKGEVFGGGRTVEEKVESNGVDDEAVVGGFPDKDRSGRPGGEGGTEGVKGSMLRGRLFPAIPPAECRALCPDNGPHGQKNGYRQHATTGWNHHEQHGEDRHCETDDVAEIGTSDGIRKEGDGEGVEEEERTGAAGNGTVKPSTQDNAHRNGQHKGGIQKTGGKTERIRGPKAEGGPGQKAVGWKDEKRHEDELFPEVAEGNGEGECPVDGDGDGENGQNEGA